MREAKLAELAGDNPVTAIDEGEAAVGADAPGADAPDAPAPASDQPSVATSRTPTRRDEPRADPATGGQKLKLGGLRSAPVTAPREAPR